MQPVVAVRCLHEEAFVPSGDHGRRAGGVAGAPAVCAATARSGRRREGRALPVVRTAPGDRRISCTANRHEVSHSFSMAAVSALAIGILVYSRSRLLASAVEKIEIRSEGSIPAGRVGPRPARPIADLAAHDAMPRKFLEAILLDLKRHGSVESRKGKGGGYFLRRRPERSLSAK